jgi:antitoxin component of RelBE/YafQ-DinJ toxin-antitoxin module
MGKKNSSIHLKVSEQEKELLMKRAEQVGLTLSSYIRFVLLQTKPRQE